MKMVWVEKSILFALTALAALWVGWASAAAKYNCYQAQITVGDDKTGGVQDGVLFYLRGADMANFVDEVKLIWSNKESGSDLKCSGTPHFRRCYLGEDSGKVNIDLRGLSPRLTPVDGQIYLGLGDGGQYYTYVAQNSVSQTLEMNYVARDICDMFFPEAKTGHGREIVVPPPGADSGLVPKVQPSIVIPVSPKR